MNQLDSLQRIFELRDQVLSRPGGFTEQDLVYHFLGPLLRACGWQDLEVFFEKPLGRWYPDVTLILHDQSTPILTVEAKKPDEPMPPAVTGAMVPVVNNLDKNHTSCTQQVLDQLLSGRHLWACLTNGLWFGLFTNVGESRERLLSMESVSARSAGGATSAGDRILQMLSREIYASSESLNRINDRRGEWLAAVETSLRASTMRPDATGSKPDVPETPVSRVRLPAGWQAQLLDWVQSFPPSTKDPALKLMNRAVSGNVSPVEKTAIYEALRFAKNFFPRLQGGWELKFIKKQTDDVILQLYPPWFSQELSSGKSFLFQITPGDQRPGEIWLNVKNGSYLEAKPDSPNWHYLRVKEEMKRALGKVFLYQPGVTDKLLNLVDTAVTDLLTHGLIRAPLRGVVDIS